jgi:hypothetical protein
MAQYTRSNGANARAQGWDDPDEQRQTRSNWLPLDDLEEEVYAATPQVQAVPRTERQVLAPPRPQPVRPTREHPARDAKPQKVARPAAQAKGVPARGLAMAAGAALTALALYVAVTAFIEWTQVKLDDFQYGRPRTFQTDAYVGHSESEGVPSHFIAMNLNRRVTILELPGSDSTKATTIVGPYLFGQGEDLTPVQVSAQDVNGDSKPDLVVSVKNEQLIYLNDGSAFKLIGPEERAAIEKAQSAVSPQTSPQEGK